MRDGFKSSLQWRRESVCGMRISMRSSGVQENNLRSFQLKMMNYNLCFKKRVWEFKLLSLNRNGICCDASAHQWNRRVLNELAGPLRPVLPSVDWRWTLKLEEAPAGCRSRRRGRATSYRFHSPASCCDIHNPAQLSSNQSHSPTRGHRVLNVSQSRTPGVTVSFSLLSLKKSHILSGALRFTVNVPEVEEAEI